MSPALIHVGVRAGLIAASATAGALLAFGLRLGTPVRPFNAVARLALGAEADGVWGFVPVVTLSGVSIHVLLSILLGVTLAWLAPPQSRIARRVGVAALLATTAYLLDVYLLPRLLRPGLAALLALPQLVLFYLVLAIALVLGTRNAFRFDDRDRRTIDEAR